MKNSITPNHFQKFLIKRIGIDKWLEEKNRNKNINIDVTECDDFDLLENKMWYEGQSEQLEFFYKSRQTPYIMEQYKFWRVVNSKMPRLHYPLASTISNAFGSLLFNQPIEFNIEEEYEDRLKEIVDVNDLQVLLQTAARIQSYSGAVAFKINYDTSLIDVPLITVYPKENFTVHTKYNQLIYIDFIDEFEGNFKLISRYGRGYINYILYHNKDRVSLQECEETRDLKDIAFFDTTNQLIPIMFGCVIGNKTKKGESDYKGLKDTFQALDETYSTLVTYIRRTKPNVFITEDIAKKDQYGNVLPLNEFDNIITVLDKRGLEDSGTRIERSIEEIKVQGYIDTLNQLRNTILERVGLSPATVGIEGAGANASAEAIRIREGASIKTRGEKLAIWEEGLKEFASALVNFDYFMHNAAETSEGVYSVPDTLELNINVVFGEYAKEAFSEKVETYSGLYEKGLISLEFAVNQLYGKELTEEEIKTLIEQIKENKK